MKKTTTEVELWKYKDLNFARIEGEFYIKRTDVEREMDEIITKLTNDIK